MEMSGAGMAAFPYIPQYVSGLDVSAIDLDGLKIANRKGLLPGQD